MFKCFYGLYVQRYAAVVCLLCLFSMEPHQRESVKKSRRNSKTLLQDLIHKGVQGGDRDTPVSLIRTLIIICV